jgi:hypothetical protein
MLHSLKQATTYEVRVSYPATIPCDIHIDLLSEDGNSLTPPSARRLLNVEKLIFRTDDAVTVDDGNGNDTAVMVRGEAPWVEVAARKAGVHRDELRDGFGRRELVYDIVLERLELGVIPAEAFIVGGIVLLFGVPMAWMMAKVLDSWSTAPSPEAVPEKLKIHKSGGGCPARCNIGVSDEERWSTLNVINEERNEACKEE